MSDGVLIKLAGVEFSDDPPSIPDGASRWEAQELRRHWRNAERSLRETARLAADLHRRNVMDTDPHRPNFGGGGLVYHAHEAVAALVEYHAVHDAVIHRLALAEHEETPG